MFAPDFGGAWSFVVPIAKVIEFPQEIEKLSQGILTKKVGKRQSASLPVSLTFQGLRCIILTIKLTVTSERESGHTLPVTGEDSMDPFALFDSPGIYKLVVLYFSRSRGLAIVGRQAQGDNVEVVQISGEVDPHTGNFVALDYSSLLKNDNLPLISKVDFEKLVTYIGDRIDNQTRMSVIEPEVMRLLAAQSAPLEPGDYLQ